MSNSKKIKKYAISQVIEVEAVSEEEAWSIFNSISRDDWEIEEVKE